MKTKLKPKMRIKMKARPVTRAVATRPKSKPRSTSTALVKAAPVILPAPVADRTITDGISLGQLGLVEVKLTEAEEKTLAVPVAIDDVLIKPTKDGQVYVPHIKYTGLLNRAFGRLGWALVAVGAPKKTEKGVVVPYILYIHGQPVAFAWGEQDYHEDNKEQSYGDAIESTVAYGLRRTAKRIGIWLELWDRAWTRAFLREHGVRVRLKPGPKAREGDKPRYVWRRRDDEPFWNEEEGSAKRSESRQRKQETRPDRKPPPAGVDGKESETISIGTAEQPGQWFRLWQIIRRVGRTDLEVQNFLKAKYGVTSSKEIKRKDYDDIVRAIESRRPLLPDDAPRTGELVTDADIPWGGR